MRVLSYSTLVVFILGASLLVVSRASRPCTTLGDGPVPDERSMKRGPLGGGKTLPLREIGRVKRVHASHARSATVDGALTAACSKLREVLGIHGPGSFMAS